MNEKNKLGYIFRSGSSNSLILLYKFNYYCLRQLKYGSGLYFRRKYMSVKINWYHILHITRVLTELKLSTSSKLLQKDSKELRLLILVTLLNIFAVGKKERHTRFEKDYLVCTASH